MTASPDSKVDDAAPERQRQPERHQRRTRPLPAFTVGFVWQAHDMKGQIAADQLHLDAHWLGINALKSKGW